MSSGLYGIACQNVSEGDEFVCLLMYSEEDVAHEFYENLREYAEDGHYALELLGEAVNRATKCIENIDMEYVSSCQTFSGQPFTLLNEEILEI